MTITCHAVMTSGTVLYIYIDMTLLYVYDRQNYIFTLTKNKNENENRIEWSDAFFKKLFIYFMYNICVFFVLAQSLGELNK